MTTLGPGAGTEAAGGRASMVDFQIQELKEGGLKRFLSRMNIHFYVGKI